MHLAKHVLRDMVSRDEGRILFTSSIASTMPGSFQAVYNAYAAASDHQGARACGWLSADARQRSRRTSRRRVDVRSSRLQLSGRRARRVEFSSTNAAVALRGGDTMYLQETADGWRISAAGCRRPGYDHPA